MKVVMNKTLPGYVEGSEIEVDLYEDGVVAIREYHYNYKKSGFEDGPNASIGPMLLSREGTRALLEFLDENIEKFLLKP